MKPAKKPADTIVPDPTPEAYVFTALVSDLSGDELAAAQTLRARSKNTWASGAHSAVVERSSASRSSAASSIRAPQDRGALDAAFMKSVKSAMSNLTIAPASDAAPGVNSVYHEQQSGMNCARHATNNVIGYELLSSRLLKVVEEHCALKLTLEAGLNKRDSEHNLKQILRGFLVGGGNFGEIGFTHCFKLLEIPFAELHSLNGVTVQLADGGEARLVLPQVADQSCVQGVILATKNGHWLGLRKLDGGAILNLDSLVASAAANTPMQQAALADVIGNCKYACIILDKSLDARKADLIDHSGWLADAFDSEIAVFNKVRFMDARVA